MTILHIAYAYNLLHLLSFDIFCKQCKLTKLSFVIGRKDILPDPMTLASENPEGVYAYDYEDCADDVIRVLDHYGYGGKAGKGGKGGKGGEGRKGGKKGQETKQCRNCGRGRMASKPALTK